MANLDIMASAKYIFIFPFNAMPHAVYSINQVLSGYCLATQALSPLSPASTFYEYTHKQVRLQAHIYLFMRLLYMISIMTVINQRLYVCLLRCGGKGCCEVTVFILECFLVLHSVFNDPSRGPEKSRLYSANHSSHLPVS